MSVELEVELARRSDARQIAEMSRDLIEAGLGWQWRPRRVEHQMTRRDTVVAVVRGESGQVLGFGIMRYHELEAHLMLFAVAPECRRRGVGRRLLGWLEETAQTAGIERVVLEVRSRNQGAQAFYRSAGYRPQQVMVGYYARASRTEDAVRMTRRLVRPARPDVVMEALRQLGVAPERGRDPR